MLGKMTKIDLISLVNKILESEGTEQEIDQMIGEVERNVVCPDIIDLIFWNDEELTAQEIVDIALAYEPIRL